MNSLLKSILAGVSIAIGGIVFLVCDDKFIGASLFSIGLLMVCTFNLNLYTGKVCYITNIKEMVRIWFGNLIGTFTVGKAIQLTRLAYISEKASVLCQTKLNDSLISIFILSILCNVMIYLGVENYKNNPHQIGKYVAIYLCIVVFIMAGFEHCVANMFYFTLAGVWNLKVVGYLLVMTIGNAVGGIMFARLKG